MNIFVNSIKFLQFFFSFKNDERSRFISEVFPNNNNRRTNKRFLAWFVKLFSFLFFQNKNINK